jgi:enoyl-CoA hydratase/carnithine racemase
MTNGSLASQLVTSTLDGGIALLCLDRPAKHNALNTELVTQLRRELAEIRERADLGAVVLTGTGSQAFCAGADIHEMTQADPEHLTHFLRSTRQLFLELAGFPLPTIAAVNGHAHGGGAELACACDLRIGCEATTFRFPGVVYGMAVSTWQLPQIVGIPRAKELLYTGNTVAAEEALRIGLLNRQVKSEDLARTARELAKQIASHPRQAVQAIKSLVDREVGAPLTQRFYRELYSNQDRGVASGSAARFAPFFERKR